MTRNEQAREYTRKGKKDKDVYLQAIAIIDQHMCLIVICSVQEARARQFAHQVGLVWSNRFPLHNKIITNKKKDLSAKFKTTMANDHGIPYSPISTGSPQDNAIAESLHQTIGNAMPIYTFKICIQIIRTLGKEFFQILCSSYGLWCTQLRSIHHYNWYLVGTRSLISTRKPTGN